MYSTAWGENQPINKDLENSCGQNNKTMEVMNWVVLTDEKNTKGLVGWDIPPAKEKQPILIVC